MSEATLTVPTAFVDISQLAEGLADRVDEGRLMLYGPEPFEEGSWVRFAVLLEDQSPALEGVGRAVTSIDGGEERPEVARWDIVLDNLQLDGTGEVVYERILMVRGGSFDNEPATGEVSLDEVEQVEEGAAAPVEPEAQPIEAEAQPVPVDAGDEFTDESTAVAQPEDYQSHVDASADAQAEAYGAEEYAQPSDYGAPAGTEGGEEDEATVVGEAPSEMLDAAQAAPEEPAAADAGFQDPGVAADADQAYGGEEAYGEEPYGEQPVAGDQDAGEPAWGDSDAAYGDQAYQDAGEAAYGDDAAYGQLDELAVDAGDVDVSDVDMGDIEDITSLPPAAPAPQMPAAPPGFQVASVGADGRALTRPSVQASWYPQAEPPPDPQPSSGLFAYAGGIPIPGSAPRPDLDPSLRIRPAPRPAPGATESQPAPAPEAADYQPDADAPYDQPQDDWGGYEASPEITSPDTTSPDVTSPDQELPPTIEGDLDQLEGSFESVDPGDLESIRPGEEPEDYQAEGDAGDVVSEVDYADEETNVEVETPEDEERQ